MEKTNQIEALRNIIDTEPETKEEAALRDMAMQVLFSYGIFE